MKALTFGEHSVAHSNKPSRCKRRAEQQSTECRCAFRPAKNFIRESIRTDRRLVVAQAEPLENPLPTDIELPTRLNNVPHFRETRQYFYDDVSNAVQKALAGGEKRLSVRCTIPETNPEMDVYRIGTILELVRDLAMSLAQDGKLVKICVQQALGKGVFKGLPLTLSGVRRILEAMDWGDGLDFVRFGEVGSNQIDGCDYYVIIAPQNVVGNTIMTDLSEMVEASEANNKRIIILNPNLKDVPSAAGVMGIRGRKERMEFAESFKPAYHFRLLYTVGSYWPIKGAMRHVYGEPWELFKRVDLGKKEEEYQLMALFDESPDGGQITECFQKSVKKKKKSWW